MTKKNKEEGQGLVEYALVLVLVALAVMLVLSLLGSRVVLAYAQVIAGLNGDTLDDNAVMLSSDMDVSGSNVCTATISNISFIVTDSEGNPLTNQSVTATILANGSADQTITGTANGSGMATVAGPISVTASCPLKITLSD
ncbi:MAG: hypothetical protein KC419_22835 [Anaerolineales bacterium]|nr:hypothetical protein [Anaerolineales bacterium]